MRTSAGTLMNVARGIVMALAPVTIVALAIADGAQAHEVRFVASYGSGRLCTREAPCASLQRGIDRTPAGGELIVLDSSDYGDSAVIDKSITISATGVSATLGGPITINAPDATVVLRGLRLNGAGAEPLAEGISIVAAAAVHIENLEIQAFSGSGIGAAAVQSFELFVSNTVVRGCARGLEFGTVAGGTLTVDESRFERNTFDGIYMRASVEATITNVVVSGNGGYGIYLDGREATVMWTTAEHNHVGFGVNSGEMTLEQSVARGNTVEGLYASGGSVRISESVVTDNLTGINQSGGTVFTRVNNTITGNASDDVRGVLTPLGGV